MSGDIEPWVVIGHYDEVGNWIPGYYDDHGTYHRGHGWFDEHGEWRVVEGYYDPSGAWISTDGAQAEPTICTEQTGLYDASFWDQPGGDVLEIAFLWRDQVVSVTELSPTRRGRAVIVGPGAHDDYVLDGKEYFAESFPLVRFVRDAYLLTVHESMTVRVRDGEAEHVLSDMIRDGRARRIGGGWHELELSHRMGASIQLEEHMFLLRFSDRLAVESAAMGIDREPLPYIGASALTHILLLMLVLAMPDRAGALELDAHHGSDRFVQLALTDVQEPEDPPERSGSETQDESTAKHAGEEGEAGDPDEAPTDRRLAVEGPRENEDLELQKERDREIARSAGIAHQISSLYAVSDRTIGADAESALGNLDGGEIGSSSGFGGWGVRSTGRGGGGHDDASIGLDDDALSTRGISSARKCRGTDCGDVDLDRDPGVPQAQVIPQPPQLQGALDREIIARVVRQHRREIKNCYERELQKNRSLAGEVTIKFTIAPNGSVTVASVAHSSMNNARVEMCLTRRIKRWIFPEPSGRGIVIVKYPFRFRTQ